MTPLELEQFIFLNGDIINFGTEADRVGDEWLSKAEQRIGLKLSNSYKWFLRTYSGGEVGSEEIFSLYGLDFDNINGGDIVFQHLMGLKNNTTDLDKLVISRTDFGEIFFFD